MVPSDPQAEQRIDHTIRKALAATGVLGHEGEYVTRYVVMAETVRRDEHGCDQYQQYKFVPPGQSRGCTRELLETGLEWTPASDRALNPGA